MGRRSDLLEACPFQSVSQRLQVIYSKLDLDFFSHTEILNRKVRRERREKLGRRI
jgi:hypothetical protein